MSEEKQRILEMLSEQKITVEEAQNLLNAVEDKKEIPTPPSPPKAPEEVKFLRVQVSPKDGESGDKVNIKVPFQLLQAGVKLASFMPDGVQEKVNGAFKEKGIDFDLKKAKDGNLQELINGIAGVAIDVESENENVKIFCE